MVHGTGSIMEALILDNIEIVFPCGKLCKD